MIVVDGITKAFASNTQQSWWKALLTPQFKKTIAVNNISFAIKKGEFVGFLGPNGAGKSTTIKMLTGILTPTSGRMVVNGIVPYCERQRHAFNIGVVFGQRTQLWWDLPPRDSFKLLGRIYRVPAQRFADNLERFVKMLELEECLHTPVRKLSLGQKMRCELAAAFLHDPQVLFLDEPTIGLDVFAKEAIRSFLKEVNREMGTTVVLTTHDLDDVENLCQRVIIIDKGSLLCDESLASLMARFGDEKIIGFELAHQEEFVLPDGCQVVRREGFTHYLNCGTVPTPEVIRRVLEHNKVQDISFGALDINEVIKRAYLG
jgi:ABC-2 type transport system ATP-binding protein